MNRLHGRFAAVLSILFLAPIAYSQKAPASPDKPWQANPGFAPVAPARSTPALVPDPAKVYTLSELVNIAEQNNPNTRVAWQNAKARAADLGVSKSTLYPTLAALALADSARVDILFDTDWIRQTTGTFSPTMSLDYIIFDFGRRWQEIAISRSNLLSANFLFNDTHRKVIFQVMEAY
jgi:outer membrane protein